MPIEIREIIIRTEIVTGGSGKNSSREKETGQLKRQLLEECKRMLAENNRKNLHKR